MNEELKPCPFCGGQRLERDYHDGKMHVVCNNCETCGPSVANACGDEGWNRRPQPEQQASAPVTDERAAFEAAYAGHDFKRDIDSPECYAISGLQYAWEGWQARAALAQPAAPSENTFAKHCSHCVKHGHTDAECWSTRVSPLQAAPAVAGGELPLEPDTTAQIPRIDDGRWHAVVTLEKALAYGQECARKAGAGEVVGIVRGWANPENDDVISAARRESMMKLNGLPGKKAGEKYSVPLYAAAPAAAAQAPTERDQFIRGGPDNQNWLPDLPERDLSKPAEQQGMFRKFDVRRVDGSDTPGGKHHGCRYFVLDLDHDAHAPAAMQAYAASCAATHPQLSDELTIELCATPAAVPQEPVAYMESYRYAAEYEHEKPFWSWHLVWAEGQQPQTSDIQIAKARIPLYTTPPAAPAVEADAKDAARKNEVFKLLWDAYPICCGDLQPGEWHMGMREPAHCCGSPDQDMLGDSDIVKRLRELFPEDAAIAAQAKERE